MKEQMSNRTLFLYFTSLTGAVTQSAVSGALYGYEFVITTSTQPVEAGKLVRLANNS